MFTRVVGKLRRDGVLGVGRAVYRRVFPERFRQLPDCERFFRGKVGLEIGGPSPIFGTRGALPVYPMAAQIDNCNFASSTVWEGRVVEGQTFIFDRRRPAGRQFVAEASRLTMVADESYDFVLSSHCLEHLADPLGALMEWMRVLRPTGALALVVPHKDATFDHRRPITNLQHLIDDRDRRTAEDDETHLDEVLRLTDLSLAPGVADQASFEARSRRNVENRCVHHHVFDTRLVISVLNEVNLQVRAIEPMRPCHIVVIAEKMARGTRATNDVFLQPGAATLRLSPFPSDRKISEAPLVS